MKNLNLDQLFLVLTLLRLQNLDKRVCDVLPCEYTCTFEETKLYKDNGLISIDMEDDTILIISETHTHVTIWTNPSDNEGRLIGIEVLLKHISFEDKV